MVVASFLNGHMYIGDPSIRSSLKNPNPDTPQPIGRLTDSQGRTVDFRVRTDDGILSFCWDGPSRRST